MEEKKENSSKMKETTEKVETSFTPSPFIKEENNPPKPDTIPEQSKREAKNTEPPAKPKVTPTPEKKVEDKAATKPVEKELAAKPFSPEASEKKAADKPQQPMTPVVQKAAPTTAPVAKKSETPTTPVVRKTASLKPGSVSKETPAAKPEGPEKTEVAAPKIAQPAQTKPETPVSSVTVKPDKVTVTAGDEAKGIIRNNRQKRIAASPIQPQEASILVVEDNVVNFRLFARLLGYMGVFEYEWKTSGWQVAEFASTMKRIDLVLLDIRLPYEDGFEVIKKLRETKNLKNTLIVAITAEASVKQMKRAQEAEFDGFIGKPIDPDKFPGQIRRILSGEPVWEIH